MVELPRGRCSRFHYPVAIGFLDVEARGKGVEASNRVLALRTVLAQLPLVKGQAVEKQELDIDCPYIHGSSIRLPCSINKWSRRTGIVQVFARTFVIRHSVVIYFEKLSQRSREVLVTSSPRSNQLSNRARHRRSATGTGSLGMVCE